MYKQGADASTEAEANEKGEQPAVAAAGPLVKRERRGRRATQSGGKKEKGKKD
ncbi:hypothetical protein OsI_35945 [Oryza sativa Indica Group]|uniref:Uncharacterized protein n=1 Tax=Oryza sativa subsp. indica TaxID=39946 RepID=A2ZDT3_ORYSI|nr:hypothetical protein OsI_35945 [Oryza sativa Indica Group]